MHNILKGIFGAHELQIDARKFQIVYLGFFLLLGTMLLDWDTQAYKVFIIVGCSLATQTVFIALGRAHISSWMSALITSLGLCLLFRGNDVNTLVLASVLAISSKFLLRFRGKHLFNPANFGIIAAILLTNDGWISPGQWGSSVILFFIIGALGSVVLLKVGRLDTTLTFLLVFIGLEYCRTIIYLGWTHDVLLHRFTNGSFLLFAFFMITDPKTTPDHPIARRIWAICVALLAFGMSNWLYLHTAPIWALFFITPINALLDAKWRSARFRWLSERIIKPYIT
ncbi:MAG: Na+-transporting NADH:ubiquinone oxidoreductase, subunit NqrB [Flavobacteriales bacterium]|nr:Na+-transporting NADH:ubiquinone oxidoreductase, subunit NqrB [Flavobacteriales bacterium]